MYSDAVSGQPDARDLGHLESVVLLTPELWRWVNLALLKQQLVINLFDCSCLLA